MFGFYSMQLTMLRFISLKNINLFTVIVKGAVLGNWNIFPGKNMFVAPLY